MTNTNNLSSNEASLNEITSDIITISNPTGVHARPASYIFQIAKKYSQCNISLKANNKSANAKSVISILGLGLKYNSTLQVVACGDGAKQAIEEITNAFKNGLGENIAHNNANNNSNVVTNANYTNEAKKEYNFNNQVEINGIIASPGLIVGTATFFEHKDIEFEEDSNNINENIIHLKEVFKTAITNLTKEISKAKQSNNKVQTQVLEAHLSLMQDEDLLDAATNTIGLKKTPAYAINYAIDNNINILKNTNDPLLTERIADLKDLKIRLLKIALKIEEENLVFAENTIIFANDLVPSDISKFSKNVIGVILAQGSATTHVSLILRNMGIPSIVALGKEMLKLPNKTNIIVNGNNGTVIINPTADVLQTTVKQQEKLNLIKLENIKNCFNPSITTDGINITVKGNVSNDNEAAKALQLGATGIGLLRSEFLFFNSSTPPAQSEQTLLYQAVLNAMKGESVTIRTLDVGGDKPLNYVKIAKEENPIVGIRGVRSYLDNLEIFLTQIKAILNVKPLSLIKIMLPMISDVEEFKDFKNIINKEIEKLNITERVEIGTMIEVPSAALAANHMAKYADFLSIGTNDLAQYTMAMDRGNPLLGKKLSNLSPSLLQLIKITVNGANEYNKSVAVCGAMASELKAIPILIGLGIKELSTSARSIPDVKALIRTLNFKKCQEIANQALQLETFKQVEDLINQHFNL